MRLITKNSDYAVRALTLLAQERDSFLSAKYISQSTKIPYSFLRRILRILIENKILTSKGGVLGGFKLNRNPEKISLSTVLEIMQGNIQLSECMFRKKICPNRSMCVLRQEIQRIEKIVNKEFFKITIGTLMRK